LVGLAVYRYSNEGRVSCSYLKDFREGDIPS
jgi:hypothetical protein